LADPRLDVASVRRRRLEQCREALFVTPTRSIADITFAWGFNSLSSFYGGFVAEFGISLGELREQRARSGSATEPDAPPRAARKE
jgi:transcriptional regulator GlxA family with amidase domain